MAAQEQKGIRQELLMALYEARKRVAALEAALARHNSLLGEGVERESTIGKGVPASADSVESLLHHYLGLIEPDEDISNFIGREGHEASRPRLGPDAPPEVRPDKPAALHPLVSRLVEGHPDDTLFLVPDGDASSAAQAALLPEQEGSDAGTGPSREAFFPPAADEAVNGSGCPRSCLVLRAFNEGVWDWDLLSGKWYASPRWREIMGGDERQGEESPLEHFAERIHPSDVAEFRACFDALRTGAVNRLEMGLRFKREKGDFGRGTLRAAGIRSNEEISRIIAVLRDISPQCETGTRQKAGAEKPCAPVGEK